MINTIALIRADLIIYTAFFYKSTILNYVYLFMYVFIFIFHKEKEKRACSKGSSTLQIVIIW